MSVVYRFVKGQACTYAHTNVGKHAHTHVHTQTHSHTHIHTHTNTLTQAYFNVVSMSVILPRARSRRWV